MIWNVTFIIGTRPEAIKLCPLIKIFSLSNYFKTRVILTGQHSEMVHNVVDLFEIKIDNDLQILKKGQTLSSITKLVVEKLELEFTGRSTDMVFVQGDTTTAFASSLAAFYEKIPVAHVEAGLRTDSVTEPFPEEANRRFISQIAELNFAPTDNAKNNLIKSDVLGEIHVTGNTVVDALCHISEKITGNIKYNNLENNKLILLTVHRRENWGENLQKVILAIKEIIRINQDIVFFIPLHPNKIVRDPFLKEFIKNSNVILSEPLNYIDLLSVMKKSKLILTDSGGIQEEAPSFNKPVLVLRNKTERIESIESNCAKLVGCDISKIVNSVNELINDDNIYNDMSCVPNPYGDGNASKIILEKSIEFLKKK